MKNYKDVKKKALRNRDVKKAYDDLGPEFAVVEMIAKKRLEQGLTQKQLAEKIGTKQPVISRLEKGDFSPSLRFLQKLARALDTEVKVSISGVKQN